MADIQNLPFPDGSFDVAVANWVLYHVQDRALAIAELARVLTPTGRFVGCYNPRPPAGAVVAGENPRRR